MTAQEIDEVRGIVRLEALRSAVFSVASESLDDNITRLVVDISLVGDSLAASFHYSDSSGDVVMGGAL